jgi:hypothetical protein
MKKGRALERDTTEKRLGAARFSGEEEKLEIYEQL